MSSDVRKHLAALDIVRIPCILLVIFVHISGYRMQVVDASVSDYQTYLLIRRLFGGIFGALAVPVFFLVSGYLFFLGSSFDFTIYRSKLKKRIRTLLVPYLIWNTSLLLVKLLPVVFPVMSGIWLCEFPGCISLRSILSAYWNFNSTGYPIVVPLWFLRDLIVVSLFSPLVYFFVKHLGAFGIAVILLCYCGVFFDEWLSLVPFDFVSIVFFSLGAFFSIKGIDLIKFVKEHSLWSLLYIPLVILELLYVGHDNLVPYIHRIAVLFGWVGLMAFSAFIAERYLKSWNTASISGTIFFIYAFHDPWLVITGGRLAELFFPFKQDWAIISGYFLSAVLIATIGYMIWKLLCRIAPGLAGILVGMRV